MAVMQSPIDSCSTFQLDNQPDKKIWNRRLLRRRGNRCKRAERECGDRRLLRRNDLHGIYEFLNIFRLRNENKWKKSRKKSREEFTNVRCAFDIVRRPHMRCAAALVFAAHCSPSAKCPVSTISILQPKHTNDTNSPEYLRLPNGPIRARVKARERSFARLLVQIHIIEVNWSDWLYNCWKYAFSLSSTPKSRHLSSRVSIVDRIYFRGICLVFLAKLINLWIHRVDKPI